MTAETAVSETSDSSVTDDESYVYVINRADNLQLDDTVTLQIGESDIFLRFQIDSGADVNVLPVHKYVAVTGDHSRSDVRPSHLRRLTSFTGHQMPVVGCVSLPVTRYDKRSVIQCQLVEGTQYRAILGKVDSKRLGIIEAVDTDAQRMPASTTSRVLSIAATVYQGHTQSRTFVCGSAGQQGR